MQILTDEIKDTIILKAHERLQEKHGLINMQKWNKAKYYKQLKKEILLIVKGE